MTPDVSRVLERIEELFALAPGEKSGASRPAFSYGVKVDEEARERAWRGGASRGSRVDTGWNTV